MYWSCEGDCDMNEWWEEFVHYLWENEYYLCIQICDAGWKDLQWCGLWLHCPSTRHYLSWCHLMLHSKLVEYLCWIVASQGKNHLSVQHWWNCVVLDRKCQNNDSILGLRGQDDCTADREDKCLCSTFLCRDLFQTQNTTKWVGKVIIKALKGERFTKLCG